MATPQEQQELLEQLWAVTDSNTPAAKERDERLLKENGWNVQATVEQIFSMGPSSSSSPTTPAGPSHSSQTSPRFEQMQVQDPEYPPYRPTSSGRPSADTADRRARSGSGTGRSPGTAGAGLNVLDIVFGPVRFVLGLVSGVWYFIVRSFMPVSFLRYLPPFLRPPSITAHSRSKSRQISQNPTAVSQAWVRDLEQFTGQAGNLPDFYIGPYREFLENVKKEGKVGMVVLVCAEHEDDAAFKRSVLADSELVRFLREREVMIWGADVRSREGYQVAGTLLATTYPSIYFVSLLPGQAGAAPKMSILTSLSGSPSTTTSSANIIQTLTTSVIPRTTAFLARLKRERSTLEEARHLREEQDRAFRAAEERDREKARVQREKEAAVRTAEETRVKEEKRKVTELENRRTWRRYARKHLLPSSSGPLRVSLRTPLDAARNIRQFEPSSSTESLFIYAETLLIPPSDTPDTDPAFPPPGYEPPKDFRIVTSFPRKEISRLETGGEETWSVVKQAGGALFAEKVEGSEWGEAEKASEGDSDEEIIE